MVVLQKSTAQFVIFSPTDNQIYTAKWKNVPKYRALHQGYNTEE